MPFAGFRPIWCAAVPGNRSMVAVGGDARPETAINALLDLLAWQWQLTVEAQKPGDAADLLVGDGPTRARC
jgi:hypothetical protein